MVKRQKFFALLDILFEWDHLNLCSAFGNNGSDICNHSISQTSHWNQSDNNTQISWFTGDPRKWLRPPQHHFTPCRGADESYPALFTLLGFGSSREWRAVQSNQSCMKQQLHARSLTSDFNLRWGSNQKKCAITYKSSNKADFFLNCLHL